jgi:orotate phosphoribosyltransferase
MSDKLQALDLQALAKSVASLCHRQGHFTLRSGQEAAHYWDKYRFEADPFVLRAVARALLNRLPATIDVFAGLELGGIPIATALGLESSRPIAFVRKMRKTYGMRNLLEGADVSGKSICLVEDVVTTGGQALESLREVRKEGGMVTRIACVIFRGRDLQPFLRANVELVALFTGDDLERALNVEG